MMKKLQKTKRALQEVIGIYDGVHAYTGPRCVQIDLTNKCNNDCIGCWCNSPLLEEKRLPDFITEATLPKQLVISLLDDLCAMGTEEIYFAGGGEPFMHPDALEIFLYAKQKGFIVSINTNFTIVDTQSAEKLVDAGVDHMIVSVWAGSGEVYSATHPNQDETTFRQLKETLSYLNEYKGKKGKPPIIKVYDVISNLNYHEFEEMIHFVAETGSESVEFTLLDTIPEKTDRLLLSESESQQLLDVAKKMKELYGGEASSVFLANYDTFLRRLSSSSQDQGEYDRQAFEEVPCYAGWAFARIIASGDVNSCLKSHRIPIGNLHNASFAELWNNDRQKEFRERTRTIDARDPYFRFIGNDTNAEVGCYRSCDNLGHSLLAHNNEQRIPKCVRPLLKSVAQVCRVTRTIVKKSSMQTVAKREI